MLVLVSTSATIYFSSRSIAALAAGGGGGGSDTLEDVLTGGNKGSGGDPFGSLTAGEHISQRPMGGGGGGDETEAGKTVATFNVAMMLIAMYWCMVLTDWGSPHRDEASDSSPTAGKVVMVSERVCHFSTQWMHTGERQENRQMMGHRKIRLGDEMDGWTHGWI